MTPPGNLLVLMLLLGTSLATSSDSRPNIVLFMVDDLGMGDPGCFGNTTLRTPNIDKIAAEGVKMTHSIAAASVCTPSRAAFMTGRYPIRMGLVPTNVVRVNIFTASTGGLPQEEITIAELVKQKDYATALIGKWHLGLNCERQGDFCHHPQKQGFDYFFGMPLTNLKDYGKDGDSVWTTRIPQLDLILLATAVSGILAAKFLQKFGILGKCGFYFLCVLFILGPFLFFFMYRNFAVWNALLMKGFELVEQPIDLYDNLTQKFVQESVEFLEERHKDQRPFLLVIPWIQVHVALHCAKEFQGRSQHGPYGDNVEEMDWSVGEVLNALEKFNMKDNTFVYLTSDNGGHVEEKGIHGNREGGWNGIYKGGKTQGGMDGGIRVPTVAMWPNRIPPGHVIDNPVSLMDIFPTIGEITKTTLPKDRIIDGKNILPLLMNKTSERPHEFLIHYCGEYIHAARWAPLGETDIWKVHYATPDWVPGTQSCAFVCDCYGNGITYHDPPLLFNIGKDPSEDHPLDPNTVENKKIIETIKTAVHKHEQTVDHSVEDQYSVMNLFPRPWLQMCCNFPYCNCKYDKK